MKLEQAMRGRQAFTLVELLVALVLLGLLSLGLTGLLENTEGTIESADRVMVANTRLRSLDAILGSVFAEMRLVRLSNDELSALPADLRDTGEQQGLLRANIRFYGGEHHIGFCVADSPVFSRTRGQMHWVELYVRESDGETPPTLMLRETPFLRLLDEPFTALDSNDEPLPVREMELLRGVEEVTFFYNVTRRTGFVTAEAWEYAELPVNSAMPLDAEIVLTLENGDTVVFAYDIGTKFEEWMELTNGRTIEDLRQEGSLNPF